MKYYLMESFQESVTKKKLFGMVICCAIRQAFLAKHLYNQVYKYLLSTSIIKQFCYRFTQIFVETSKSYSLASLCTVILYIMLVCLPILSNLLTFVLIYGCCLSVLNVQRQINYTLGFLKINIFHKLTTFLRILVLTNLKGKQIPMLHINFN